jgi:hypothetical protein
MENYTNSEMTDMILCCGSADGAALRAQALCKHFWLLSTGKWHFLIEKCGQGPKAYTTGVRLRAPNSRDCGRKPVKSA